MCIGLLGGSFNPIHNGHLHIAKYVRQELALDRVVFIPTGDPPHKPASSLAPARHRLKMVKLATESFKEFEVDEYEARTPAVSYSIDTVTRLKNDFPMGTKLAFIMGLDAFLEFPSWYRAPQLLEMCQIIVCSRPEFTFTQLQTLPFLPPTPLDTLESLDRGHKGRLDVALPRKGLVTLLSVPPYEVSASQIRKQIALQQPIGHWLPPSVESYIIQHQVYQ